MIVALLLHYLGALPTPLLTTACMAELNEAIGLPLRFLWLLACGFFISSNLMI